MFRIVEYFNTANNGDYISDPTTGAWYSHPQGSSGFQVSVDANGYKYAHATGSIDLSVIFQSPSSFDNPNIRNTLSPSTPNAYYYYCFTTKFNNTPSATEENYSYISQLWCEMGNNSRAFIFLVLQYDSDGFGTMKNGLYIRYRWEDGQQAWRIIDDFNLTDLYTIELKVYTDKFIIRVLQNNEEITNETHLYSEFSPNYTNEELHLNYITVNGDKTNNDVYFYYWEYGLYDIDCSEGESDKLYVDGTVVPNATIYFLDNDSSSGTYQKVIGTAVTDADGSYTLPSGVSPPYIAFGTTPSGYGFCVKVDS